MMKTLAIIQYILKDWRSRIALYWGECAKKVEEQTAHGQLVMRTRYHNSSDALAQRLLNTPHVYKAETDTIELPKKLKS